MTVPLIDLKRHLLTMLGGGAVPVLGPGEWRQLAIMAAQHRLGPLLAFQLLQSGQSHSVSSEIMAAWQDARQRAGLVTLGQQAGLRVAAAQLGRAGIGFVALKGPRLAWSCYPEQALRPMRDLDLLVASDVVLDAARALAGAGFAMQASDKMVAEAVVAHKHLPPLWHAGLDVTIEVHHRLVDPPGSRGYHLPQLDAADVLAAATPVRLAGMDIACPTPTAMLAHLIVHALYGHLLDCGPLVLADIHYLLASENVDKQSLVAMAEQQGWLRGASLLLELTARYFGPQPLNLGGPPPERVMAAAEDALLQDFDSREHRLALADILAARSPNALLGALAMRLRPSENVVYVENAGHRGFLFWLAWAYRRLSRLAARVTDRRASAEGGNAVALMRWLQNGRLRDRVSGPAAAHGDSDAQSQAQVVTVTQFQRHPVPGWFSVERLFGHVRENLPPDIDVKLLINRRPSKGLLPRLLDAIAARRASGPVNHILGDVHYLAWFLPRRNTLITVLDCVPLERLTGWRRQAMWLLWYWWPLKRAGHVVVISEFTRRSLLGWVRYPADRVAVIPPSVSEKFVYSPPRPHGQWTRVLQIGATENKNLLRIIAALRGLDVTLVMVGTPSEAAGGALAEGRLRFESHPEVGDDELIELYRGADLLLFPSTYEGWGMPIIEAQATGRPVVTSAIASMPEAAGGAACLVDPFDVASIREGVVRVLADENYALGLIDAGLANAARYSGKEVASRYADLYREIGAADRRGTA